jgi:hypothetical protein
MPFKDELQAVVDIGEWLWKEPCSNFKSEKNKSVTVIEEEAKLGSNFESDTMT